VTIWKYAIPDAVTLLELPAGSTVLHVAHQGGVDLELYIWVLHDPMKPKTKRQFSVRGTGETLGAAEKRAYIGTVHHQGYVWHIFEDLP
jgi:hypothetical protein